MIITVELAPGVDKFQDQETLRFEHTGDGWQLLAFKVLEDMPGCVGISDEPVDVVDDLYGDPRIQGWVHGTDCALSLWVAHGEGDSPDCQRLKEGGSFRMIAA